MGWVCRANPSSNSLREVPDLVTAATTRGVLTTSVVIVLCSLLAGCAAPSTSSPAALAPLRSEPGVLLPAGCRGIEALKQFQRGFWDYRSRADRQGRIPPEARERALAQIRTFKLRTLAALAEAPMTWESIGPAPIVGASKGPNASGRVTAIAIDPADPEHWLMGAAQGGVWERRDGKWEPRTDDGPSLSIGALAFAPHDRMRAYAGTGEVAFSPDAYGGAGLLRSDNGGQRWAPVHSVLDGPPGAIRLFESAGFSRILVAPTDPRRLVVATARSRLTQSGGFTDPMAPTGVLVSDSGGERFTLTLPGTATDLAASPANFQQQYAAIGDPCGDASGTGRNGVHRSTDGGRSWKRIPGPWGSAAEVGRIRLAIAPSDPRVVYVSVQRPFGKNAPGEGGLLGLWRTDDAWIDMPSWTRLDTSGARGYCDDKTYPICWYAHLITVDPRDARVLYAGGYEVWRRDRDDRWRLLSDPDPKDPTRGIHADQHAFAWAGTRLVVGNDGGVWSTADGLPWDHHNHGLAITQFYRGALHPTKTGFMIGGTQDNGTAIRQGEGQAWNRLYGGDGVASVFSGERPDTEWAVTTRHQQGLDIVRIRPGKQEWGMGPKLEAPPYPGVLPFILPLTRCPDDANLLLHGAGRLWKTTNFFSSAPDKPKWAEDSPVIPGDEPRYASAIAFAPDQKCRVYALGTFNGRLWLTTGGGAAPDRWLDLTPKPFGGVVTGLAFHPKDPKVLYVTVSGFDTAHVLRTDDAFACAKGPPGCAPTWSDLTPTVDGKPVDTPFNAVVIRPDAPDVILVASDHGVWMSPSAGKAGSWQQFGPDSGLPNVAVYDLQIQPVTGEVVAFTHGRGAFVLRTGR